MSELGGPCRRGCEGVSLHRRPSQTPRRDRRPDPALGNPMTPADFQRIALSLEGAEEIDHCGSPRFRVGGARCPSLASASQGYGNRQLTLEQQAAFVEEAPEIFLPIPGGFGRMGDTHIRLAAASGEVLTGALRAAWKLRVEKSAQQRARKSGPKRAT